MRKQYLRWILPIIALLLIATIVVLSPLVASHASGVTAPTTKPVASPTAAPGKSTDVLWHF